jgi:hypothetical protein
MMGDLGLPGQVVRITDALPGEGRGGAGGRAQHHDEHEGRRKPVSFIEDCAVALEDLADYTERLTTCFERHGTKGTWYAHARSAACMCGRC